MCMDLSKGQFQLNLCIHSVHNKLHHWQTQIYKRQLKLTKLHFELKIPQHKYLQLQQSKHNNTQLRICLSLQCIISLIPWPLGRDQWHLHHSKTHARNHHGINNTQSVEDQSNDYLDSSSYCICLNDIDDHSRNKRLGADHLHSLFFWYTWLWISKLLELLQFRVWIDSKCRHFNSHKCSLNRT